MHLILMGLIGLFFFILQIFLCLKGKKIKFKLIPVYVIITGAIYSMLLYFGVFNTSSGGGFMGNIHQLKALIFFIALGISGIGIILAWAIYGLYKRLSKGTNN